jgi:4-amino-4-deoxy-L-arabinose transferase-like glycosyltransferase
MPARRVAGSANLAAGNLRFWEPFVVFLVTLAVMVAFTQRVVAHLTPTTGDEPFYLMMTISMLSDGDLNECNNYIQHDEATLYPPFYFFDGKQAYADFPDDWVGWKTAPFPLPPHAGHIVPASRQCASNYRTYPVVYDNPSGELYSKHGLGLSVMVLPAFALGGRLSVVFFLNLLGALLAVNIYLLAREGTGKMWPAVLTWVAFAFTVPLLPYSYLIFPELPAALLILYAFRRIRLMGNTGWQTLAVGLCVAALPWFHYRFAPICAGLVIYYFFRDRAAKEEGRRRKWTLLMTPAVLSALVLMAFFYQRYMLPFPNPEDHAGINDLEGTVRGAVGLFLDQQWGLFVAAPVFILTLVGIIEMAQDRGRRKEMVWIGVVALPYFLVIANYAQWWGEWCPPARYLAPVLPLLALPFAVVLDKIHGVIYKAIYGVLLLLSFLTTWGFLYEPQWMYNQPNGKSLLLVRGLPELASTLGLPFLGNLGATQFFPSFVTPYFAYFSGKQVGDAAARAAWRASLGPLIIIMGVVAICLILAHFSKRDDGESSSPTTGGSEAGEADRTGREMSSGEAISPASSRMLRTAQRRFKWMLAVMQQMGREVVAILMPRPAFAWALAYSAPVGGTWYFQGTSTDSTDREEASGGMSAWLPGGRDASKDDVARNGDKQSPASQTTLVTEKPGEGLPEPGVEDVPSNGVEAEPVAAEVEPQPEKRRVLGFAQAIWRTRGLWLGSVGIGLAMNAQRILTVDKDVLSSIRWYAIGIAVTLVAWLGTYRNKSSLARVERKPRVQKEVIVVQPVVQPVVDSVVENGVEAEGAGEFVTPLPVRKRRVIAETTGNGVETEPVVAPLPVRVKRSAESASTVRMEDGAPEAEPVLGGNGQGIAEDGSSSELSTLRVVQQEISEPMPAELVASAVPPATEPVAVNVKKPPMASRIRERAKAWRTQVGEWRERHPVMGGPWPRYLVAFGALALNVWCADQIRKDYFSSVGGWGWALSLVILAAAFLHEPKRKVIDVDKEAADIEERAAMVIPRWVEVAIVVGIMALAFALRIWRLDDLTGGMHGDEGETGMDALSIFQGDRVSPFMTGWFSHPNFSFYSIAIMMKVFGTGLFGLRIFSVVLGTLMIVPFYGLVRIWFGVRSAIIAAALLAVMDVSIYFGKLGLNNITTPFFLVVGFYFLFRGMKSLRTLDFILSGYGFMLTLFYYFGGRLTPFVVGAVLVYLFVFLPLVRVPGNYFDHRREKPEASRWKALGAAFAKQGGLLVPYVTRLALFVVASICLVSPWLVYYLDHRAEMDGRSNDKVIFNPTNWGRMEAQHHATHDPLYVGLRMPQPTDIYPWLPVVFEQTPLSVQVASDGFWPRAVWGQTTTTLSMFTYRADASSFYTFTGEPALKPIEAVFLIIGLAFALWRWKDSRMGVLSLWFWMTIFAGGVFTIDAPYMPRLVGAVPAFAILIAIPLNKLASEFIRAAAGLVEKVRQIRWERPRMFAGQAVTGIALVGLLGNLGATNVNDYYNRYMAAWPYPEVGGQAYFVQQMNQKVTAEGRPVPQYYDLGIHFIYWGHGDNRFVNQGTPGADMTNPSQELPVLNNEDRDVVFMVWGLNMHYLHEIEAYYPGGEESNYIYGPNGTGPNLFTYYRVKKEQIDAQRVTRATYIPAQGEAIMRDEPGFGTTGRPPADLQYPMQAAWAGDIVAPAYGRYSFSLETTEPGIVMMDGQQVLTTTAAAKSAQVQLLLARGPHEVTVKGALANAASQVALKWSSNGQTFEPVPRQYVWNGFGRALYGEVGPLAGDVSTPDPGPASGGGVLTTRIDGFLGFKHAPDALTGGPLRATWKGELNIGQQGTYGFETNSNGDSVLLIDNNIVVNNIRGGADAHQATGQVELAAGKHSFEVRYAWVGGTGYMEAFWTPPGGQRNLIDSSVLHTNAGIITPGLSVQEPPPVQLLPPPAAVVVEPDSTFGSGDLKRPRGIAVDSSGNVYVGDVGNNRVVVYKSDGSVLRTWGAAAPQPKEGEAPVPPKPGEFAQINDIALGSDGTVYVFDDTPRVQAFTPQGDFKGSFEATDLNLYGPNGIATGATPSSPAGTDIYIAATGQNRILHAPSVDAVKSGQAKLPDSSESITIGAGGDADRLEQPVDVVADPSGNGVLYAIDLKDRIVQLTPPGKPGGQWSISKQWPVTVGRADGGSRLAIDAAGTTVYMSDPDKKRVAVLDLATNAITYFGKQGAGPGQFNQPSGVAVARDGKVYVLDWTNGNVQVFSSNKLK